MREACDVREGQVCEGMWSKVGDEGWGGVVRCQFATGVISQGPS